MEKDRQLSEILRNSSEKPKDDFTAAVMKQVLQAGVPPVHARPLVPPRWKRLFVVVYIALVGVMLGLLLLITVGDLPVADWLQRIELPAIGESKILTFLATFWVLFSLNALYERKFGARKKAAAPLRK